MQNSPISKCMQHTKLHTLCSILPHLQDFAALVHEHMSQSEEQRRRADGKKYAHIHITSSLFFPFFFVALKSSSCCD